MYLLDPSLQMKKYLDRFVRSGSVLPRMKIFFLIYQSITLDRTPVKSDAFRVRYCVGFLEQFDHPKSTEVLI